MSNEEELVNYVIELMQDQIYLGDIEYNYDNLTKLFDSEIKRVFIEENAK